MRHRIKCFPKVKIYGTDILALFKSSNSIIGTLDECCHSGSALQEAPLVVTDEVILMKMIHY